MSLSVGGGGVDDGLDPFPLEFAQLTIGTAINADLNKLAPGEVAFRMGLLDSEGLLRWSKGHSEAAVWGAGATVESQEAWGWNASAGAELNLGIIDALAKFHIQQTNNACRKSSDVKVRGTAKYSGAFIELVAGRPEQLVGCATELFKTSITPIYEKAAALHSASDPAAKAKLSDKLVDAVNAFYGKFGTGFVDRIELEAVGVFEGTFHSNSDYTQKNLDVGGEFSLSLPGFGAGAAAKFCQEKVKATAAVEFSTRAYGRPPGCGPEQWAIRFHDAFAQHGINTCGSDTVWNVPMSNPPGAPADPVIKPLPLPDSVDLPKIAATLITDAIKAIQFETLDPIFKTDSQGVPLDRDAALQNELTVLGKQALTEQQINDQALGALAGTPVSGQPVAAFSPDSGARSLLGSDAAPRGAGLVAVAGSVGDSSLGDYAVVGYRYQPWSKIFPELDISKLRTRHQVVFLQSMVWYSIRGVFAQYLEYCANYPDIVGRGLNARGSAAKFRSALEKVGESIDRRLRDKTATNLTVIEDLERELQHELGPTYSMRKHYEYWIKNYEWLKRIPFGVVAVVERDNKHWIQVNPYPKCPYFDRDKPLGCKPLDTIEAETLLEENAYRLYPIISTDADGEPHFVWVGAPSLLTGDNEDQVARVSGLLSFTHPPQKHPGSIPPDDVRKAGTRFAETTLPMLIQQSAAAADDIARAEDVFNWGQRDFLQDPFGVNGAQRLRERWENRQAMFGMQLYPGFGEEDGFGAGFLLAKAAELAREASRCNSVVPHDDDLAKDHWRLRDADTKGPWAAYFPKYDATFFWGPGDAGWDRFGKCEILLVPIDYDKVRSVGGTVKSGGRPMWSEPRTKQLLDHLGAFAKRDGTHAEPGEK